MQGSINAYEIDRQLFYLEFPAKHLKFDTCGSGYDTWLHIYDDAENEIYTCDDCDNCVITSQTFADIYNVSIGYYLGVCGYASRPGDYVLNMSCV